MLSTAFLSRKAKIYAILALQSYWHIENLKMRINVRAISGQTSIEKAKKRTRRKIIPALVAIEL